MSLFVNKVKTIGMLLNVVHGQVQNNQQKHTSKESNRFHDQQFHLNNGKLATKLYAFLPNRLSSSVQQI